MATVKQRKSPTASATLFPVGTKRTGNDGGQWMVEANKNGVRRWIAIRQAVKQSVRLARKTVKAEKAPREKRSETITFGVYYKQSKACQSQEEGDCNPFIKSGPVEDLMWTMGFPNNPDAAMTQYDTCIDFWGPSENTDAVKTLVRREYTKLKERGAIAKFVIKDA
jgi:hypothetical protein